MYFDTVQKTLFKQIISFSCEKAIVEPVKIKFFLKLTLNYDSCLLSKDIFLCADTKKISCKTKDRYSFET